MRGERGVVKMVIAMAPIPMATSDGEEEGVRVCVCGQQEETLQYIPVQAS